MSLRSRILEYLRRVGPAPAARIAADLGVKAVPVNKALCNMAGLGTVSRIEGKPLRFEYVREPLPHSEVARRGVEALRPINEARRVDPEKRRADSAKWRRDYYHRHAERLNAKRRARYQPTPRARKSAPAPAPRPRVVTDIAMSAPSALTRARVELPAIDTDAWIRQHPECFQRLPIDAPWSTRETLTVSHRKTIEGVR